MIVEVAALGGLITAAHGLPKEASYVERVFNWINATFPNPNHQFLNHGFSGATSAYVAPCVLETLPNEPDLVLLVSLRSAALSYMVSKKGI